MNGGNGSCFFKGHRCYQVTTEEITLPVHVEEMGEVALVTDGGDRRGSFFYFYGFGFVLWDSNRAEGEGEIR